MTQIQYQTLALASMFQSATLINQLAHGESINQASFDCSLDSLFTGDAKSTEEIFGYGDGLIQGLKTMSSYLGGEHSRPEKLIVYYVLTMIKVESRMLKNAEVVQQIQQGLSKIEQDAQDFEMSRASTIHKIDGLYQKTISQIKPRVMVQGDQTHLSVSETTSKIRTLLFSGIRASVLWRQLGGSRVKLIFTRKKYIHEAKQFLLQFQTD